MELDDILKNWKNKYYSTNDKQKLLECQQYAEQNEGKCLSNTFHEGKLVWECSQTHVWRESYLDLKKGGFWCPKCEPRYNTDDFNKCKVLAEQKGGECLSTHFHNNKLTWKCSQKHI